MLELDLDRMAWVRKGRDVSTEPSTARTRGEATQEWLYTQVHRSDLGFRACDMVLAVLRLAVREAVERSCLTQNDKSNDAIEVKILCNLDSLFDDAGIPLNGGFSVRLEKILREDLSFLGINEFHDLSNEVGEDKVDLILERIRLSFIQ